MQITGLYDQSNCHPKVGVLVEHRILSLFRAIVCTQW